MDPVLDTSAVAFRRRCRVIDPRILGVSLPSFDLCFLLRRQLKDLLNVIQLFFSREYREMNVCIQKRP